MRLALPSALRLPAAGAAVQPDVLAALHRTAEQVLRADLDSDLGEDSGVAACREEDEAEVGGLVGAMHRLEHLQVRVQPLPLLPRCSYSSHLCSQPAEPVRSATCSPTQRVCQLSY